MNAIYRTGIELWALWTTMWNGRPELARDIVAPRFVLHLPAPEFVDPNQIDHPEAVQRWVSEHRARFGALEFEYGAGPFVDTVAQVVAGPWSARIVIEGAPAEVCGMDTIAFRAGKVVEYWTVSKRVALAERWTQRLSPND